jgi:hypothetical protein
MPSSICLNADAAPLFAAIDELHSLVAQAPSPLELDDNLLSAECRQLLFDCSAGLDIEVSNFVRLDSNSATDGTGDVLVSFQPSELFLELLSALRTRKCDAL